MGERKDAENAKKAELIAAAGLDVTDVERVNVKTLDLGVALSVPQKALQEDAGLLRPARLGVIVHLGLWVTANASHEATEGNGLLVLEHVLKVLLGLFEGHTLDSLGGLTRVLAH